MKWRSFGQNILELKDANISYAWISMKHTFTRTKQEMGAEFVMFSFDMLICVLYSIYVYINSASFPFMIRCMITSGNGDDTC